MSKTIRSILEEVADAPAPWILSEKIVDKALAEIEQLIIEAKIEELKYHSLFYKGRKYSDKVDWKHEVELIESMNDNRIIELSNLHKALGKE